MLCYVILLYSACPNADTLTALYKENFEKILQLRFYNTIIQL